MQDSRSRGATRPVVMECRLTPHTAAAVVAAALLPAGRLGTLSDRVGGTAQDM